MVPRGTKAIVDSKISTMCFLGVKFHHFSTKKNEEKCLFSVNWTKFANMKK
jgi:hypothetical protein